MWKGWRVLCKLFCMQGEAKTRWYLFNDFHITPVKEVDIASKLYDKQCLYMLTTLVHYDTVLPDGKVCEHSSSETAGRIAS